MGEVEDFRSIKTKVERVRSKAEQAKGALDQAMKGIKATYGCSSASEAQELLDNKREELGRVRKRLASELDKFKEKWGDKL